MKILILGGTSEATALAHLVAGEPGWDATLSLAGRTTAPAAQPIPVRVGGFGGADGLAEHLRAHRVAALIDATHPFAAQITRNATEAARRADTPFLAIVRPEWQLQHGDRWQFVPDMPGAAQALGKMPKRVLLTIGRQELAPFIAAPQHRYVVRSVEPPVAVPKGADIITARGPFTAEAEHALLQAHAIEAIVTKNSGGTATEAKLGAARALGIEVIMVERPPLPPGIAVVRTASAAFAWLMFHAGTDRGE